MLLAVALQCSKSKVKDGITASNNTNYEVADWYFKAPNDSLSGIAMEAAEKFVSNFEPKEKIIVAVLDGQIKTNHEELKNKFYQNQKETPNNFIDDDHNGYIDDISGWNYLGLKNGNAINYGNYQFLRIIRRLRDRYKTSRLDTLAIHGDDSLLIKNVLADRKYNIERAQTLIDWAENLRTSYLKAKEQYPLIFVDSAYTSNFVKNYVPKEDEKKLYGHISYFVKYGIGLDDLNAIIKKNYQQKFVMNNLEYDPYSKLDPAPDAIVYNNYGHSRIDENGIENGHGTQIVGVMAANKNNSIGIKGITDNIRIMPLAILPHGSARDKDFVNAVRYAVDNGARIINYSAGDFYLEYQEEYYEAIEYALKNNVLFVASAGNSNKNIDLDHYTYHPTSKFITLPNNYNSFLKVGASGKRIDNTLKASISNYGHQFVDVYAPGSEIKTTDSGSKKYTILNGSSFSASITSGVAAFILSYFPELTAPQVKQILLDSSTKYDIDIKVKDSLVNFKNLSQSGGIVNALEAIKLAKEVSESR